MEPARFDEMRRGCYDIEARIADMDLDGVFATLCFPSLIAGFAGTIFAEEQGSRARSRGPARVERLAHRRVGRTASRSRDPVAARVGERSRDRGRRRAPQRRARLQGGELPREPRRSAAAADASTALGSVPARVRGDRDGRLPAQRLVVVDRGPLAGCAARALHEPVPGERARHRGRLALGAGSHPVPGHQDRVLRGRHQLGADAHRPDRLRARPLGRRLARLGRRPTSRRPRRCAATSGSARSTSDPRSSCATTSASTTSASRATTRTPTRRGPTRNRTRPPRSGDVPADVVRKVTWENASKLFRHPVPDDLQQP